MKDEDHIYATVRSQQPLFSITPLTFTLQILGTGINSAGSAAPVNAPVAAAQRDAMHRAWSQSGRQPGEVDFVELHATGNQLLNINVWPSLTFFSSGTAAGDPAEANWVGDAFHREDELLIGSVKGNIG